MIPLAVVVVAWGAAAEIPAAQAAWHFDVRVDPVVTLVAQGVSAGVDGFPDDSHWRVSLAAFHAEVPALLVPLVVQPSLDVTVTEDAVQLAALYDVDGAHRGLFLGPELYVYRLRYTHAGAVADAHEAYVHVTGGYTFFPFDDDVLGRLFLQPWATLGVPIFHTGGADVGGAHLEDRALNWHATVSIGIRLL